MSSVLICGFVLGKLCTFFPISYEMGCERFSIYHFSGFRKSQSDGRFYAYSIYAFGITLIVLLIALLLDNYAEQGSILKPGIGLTSCYLQGK